MDVKRTAIFPTLIYDVNCSHLNDDVLKIFKTTGIIEENFRWNSETHDFYVISKNKKLVRNIESIVNELLSEIGYICPFKMTTSWFTHIEPGRRVDPHHHCNSVWSAVFYFYSDCSALIFEKDKPNISVKYKPKDYDLVIDGCLGFRAKHGQMLVFPSHLRHYSDLNATNENRYSLAMNFMPYGYAKSNDSSYRYR